MSFKLRAKAVRAGCKRFLSHHYPQRATPHRLFSFLAQAVDPAVEPDYYGEGDAIEAFEARIAGLLGKEAAVFMPSGTMAQQIALRVLADQQGIRSFAMHPRCHLELREGKGYSHLHGLHGVLVGHPDRLLTVDDLERVAEPLSTLVLELPQRELGGQLPSWEELTAIAAWATKRKVKLHLDGARLWECKPFYGREYAELRGLFDTVYVSFYHGLGGVGGAMLAGPADVIALARMWLRRQGGHLMRLFPYALAAEAALDERLDRMQTYHEKALELAGALAEVDGTALAPWPPHTNMLHVFLYGDLETLEEAVLDASEQSGIWLVDELMVSRIPQYCFFELVVGDASMAVRAEEVRALFQQIVQRALAG